MRSCKSILRPCLLGLLVSLISVYFLVGFIRNRSQFQNAESTLVESVSERQKLPERETNLEPKLTKLIILGYKHGGSSFTGAIIQSDPRVFYVYEPVWYIKDPDQYGAAVSDKNYPLQVRLKGKWRDIPNAPEPLPFVESLMNCDITNFTRQFLEFTFESKEINDVDACIMEKKQDPDKCFQEARKSCFSTAVRAFKTVRMSMEEAKQLMIRDPQFKVLYIVRDPRGNKMSRMGYGRKKRSLLNVQDDTENTPSLRLNVLRNRFSMQCQLMNQDVETLLEMTQDFKGRTLAVRYEDLAENPFAIAAQFFKFINLDMSEDSKKMLSVLIKSSTGDSLQARNSLVKNSTEPVSKWRSQLPFDTAREVEKDCSVLFEKMKYTIFQTEDEMRDTQIPSREKYYGEGLVTVKIP